MSDLKPNAVLGWAVMDHIETRPELWDQGRWIGKSDCGTAGCYAGWATLLSGAEPDFWADSSWVDTVVFNGERWLVEHLAEKLLRVDRHFSPEPFVNLDLFDPENSLNDLKWMTELVFGPRPEPTEDAMRDAIDRIDDGRGLPGDRALAERYDTILREVADRRASEQVTAELAEAVLEDDE
jgi:hypothetical protein